jgi:hypothetical protein
MLCRKQYCAWIEFRKHWDKMRFIAADATDAFDDFIATVAGNDRKRASVRAFRIDTLSMFNHKQFLWAIDTGGPFAQFARCHI